MGEKAFKDLCMGTDKDWVELHNSFISETIKSYLF